MKADVVEKMLGDHSKFAVDVRALFVAAKYIFDFIKA